MYLVIYSLNRRIARSPGHQLPGLTMPTRILPGMALTCDREEGGPGGQEGAMHAHASASPAGQGGRGLGGSPLAHHLPR